MKIRKISGISNIVYEKTARNTFPMSKGWVYFITNIILDLFMKLNVQN